MKKSIAIYTPSSWGGHARYTKEVAVKLNIECGNIYNIKLITSEDINDEYKDVDYEVCNILPKLKIKETYKYKIQWLVSRIFHYPIRELFFLNWLRKNNDVSIVHFQEISNYFGWIVCCIIKNFLKKEVVMTVHNVVPHNYSGYLQKFLIDYTNKLLYNQLSFAYVHSDGLKKQYIEKYKIPSNNVIVVPHGVWSLGIENNIKCHVGGIFKILFFGTIRKNKGLHILLDAVNYLDSSKFELIIAGAPVDEFYYNNAIKEKILFLQNKGKKIELQIKYLNENEVAKVFAKANFIVLPYVDFHAQSGVLFDAMAFGLPVLASKSGSLEEIINKYKIGELFDSMEPDAIAKKITRFVENYSTYAEGIVEFKKIMSWSVHAKIIANSYNNLLSDG